MQKHLARVSLAGVRCLMSHSIIVRDDVRSLSLAANSSCRLSRSGNGPDTQSIRPQPQRPHETGEGVLRIEGGVGWRAKSRAQRQKSAVHAAIHRACGTGGADTDKGCSLNVSPVSIFMLLFCCLSLSNFERGRSLSSLAGRGLEVPH